MRLAADVSACIGLAACAMTDLLSGKIPNYLILIIIFYSAITFGPAFLMRLIPAMAVALFLFYMKKYGLRLPGGGDLKLFSVMIGWYGLIAASVMVGAGMIIALGVNTARLMLGRSGREKSQQAGESSGANAGREYKRIAEISSASAGKADEVKNIIRNCRIKLAPYLLCGFVLYKIYEYSGYDLRVLS